MSMTDIVSAMQRTGFTQAGLVIFLVVFVVIVIRLFRSGHRESHRRDSMLPLIEAPIVPTPRTQHPGTEV